jgi:hypothetical protein
MVTFNRVAVGSGNFIYIKSLQSGKIGCKHVLSYYLGAEISTYQIISQN